MWFWWFMFVCSLLIPTVMIICGAIMEKHPPKKINGIYGYRTGLSMKNTDTWNFANKYCGKLWRRIGLITLTSVIALIPFYNASDDTVGIVGLIIDAVQLIALIISIIIVERKLAKTFNRDETRIQPTP